MSRLETVTVAWLARRLTELGIAALVVQFFGGKWVATISLNEKTDVYPSGSGPTIAAAIDELLLRVDHLPATTATP